jgi:predicted nucleic acid-binding protein
LTLTDAGPLIALLDRDDQAHAVCRNAVSTLAAPMVTTWPAFTEAMYLLGSRAGSEGQERLWSVAVRDDLRLIVPDATQVRRAQALMSQYRDLPMDLADASLVAYAEAAGLRQIFTLDAEFAVYRLHGRTPFSVVPARGG